MTSAPDDTRTFSEAAGAWLRTTRAVAVRSTAASFVIGLVVAALLVLVHSLDGPSGELVLGLPGLSVHTGLDESSYALPLLVAALAGWVLLTSLSRLVVARQVRVYLRALPMLRARAGGMAEPDHDGDAMAERLMLESYLSVAASAARSVAMTCALLLILPWPAACGVLLCWVVAVFVSGRRFADGRAVSVDLADASHGARIGPGAPTYGRVVDAIFLRDTRVHRLTVLQAGALLAAVLVLVVVPAWLSRPGPGAATAVLVVLLWLQALIAAVTESGGVGWRAQLWFDQQNRPRRPGGDASRGRAPRADLMWWPADEPVLTIAAVIGRGPAGGSDLVGALESVAAAVGASLAIVTPTYARRLTPDVTAAIAHPNPVVVVALAGAHPGVAGAVAGAVRAAGGEVSREVAAGDAADPSAPEVVVVGLAVVRTLADGGALDEAVRLWSDGAVDARSAEDRTLEMAARVAAATAMSDAPSASLGFDA